MNILITGGKGQLGTEVHKCLLEGKTELGELSSELIGSNVTAIDIDELDVTDIDAVDKVFLNGNYDVVINCSAYTNVNGCETDKDTAFKVNAIGVRNLAMCAEKYNCKIVHVSTDYVFSGDATEPYTEWDICNPQSVYGKTKYLGEQYVRDFSTKYYIVRTSWLYGYYGNNFVKTMQKLGSTKDEIKVVNDQIGNPTNACDLAHHILKLITTQEYGVYHCTGEGECSWYDFACKIMEYSKLNCKVNPCTTEEYPTPTKRPAYSALDNMMLRCTVGNEMRNWDDALKCFILHQNEKTN